MRKAVAALHATPINTTTNQTLNSRRLFDGCILAAQLNLQAKDPALVEQILAQNGAPVFDIRVGELARLAGIPGKNHERIYIAMQELFKLTMRWNVVGEANDVQWNMESHFISSWGRGVGNRVGWIRFSLDPTILGFVLEPSQWAALSHEVMKDLASTASYSLYQNAFRYVGTHQKVTAALPTQTWIELLMGGPSRYCVEKDGVQVIQYGDFKRRVLLDALTRVNEHPALKYTLELKELRAGNRVVKLQFKFHPKVQAELAMPLRWPKTIMDLLQQIGLSDHEVSDLGQTRSQEEIADALNRLQLAQSKGRTITALKPYFLGILGNIAAGGQGDIEDADVQAAEQALAAQQTDSARKERLRQQFDLHAAKRFREAFFELDISGREALTGAFEATDAGRHSKSTIESRGWTPENAVALRLLQAWMRAESVQSFEALLPPEDRDFNAWMAWRLDGLGS